MMGFLHSFAHVSNPVPTLYDIYYICTVCTKQAWGSATASRIYESREFFYIFLGVFWCNASHKMISISYLCFFASLSRSYGSRKSASSWTWNYFPWSHQGHPFMFRSPLSLSKGTLVEIHRNKECRLRSLFLLKLHNPQKAPRRYMPSDLSIIGYRSTNHQKYIHTYVEETANPLFTVIYFFLSFYSSSLD